ncbi:MAG: hypothetical protein ACM3O7_03890 [Acidobacteriota bacterium]
MARVLVAGDVASDPERVATLELEAQVAAKPTVYLVLDPARELLEIKSRGVLLDKVHLLGIELVEQEPWLGKGSHPSVVAPALWTIKSGAGDTDRELIAPSSLKPYPKGGEAEEDAPESGGTGPTPTPTPIPEPPISYRARLDNGWDIWVCEELPPQSFFGRFLAAVRDGWVRLKGGGEFHPPTVALAMSADDARRIHHLMRSGTEVLLAAGDS